MRPARPEDRALVRVLAPRLEGFGSLPPCEAGQMASAVEKRLREAISPPGGSSILVAEGEDGTHLGFVRVKPQGGYFADEEHAYVSELAVAEEGEGTGVGRALPEAAEDRARDRGYRVPKLGRVRAQRDGPGLLRTREVWRGLGKKMVAESQDRAFPDAVTSVP